MTVRTLSDITNTPPPSPSKAARTTADRLEDLKGFEFLDAVSRLSDGEIYSLAKPVHSFIVIQLNELTKDPAAVVKAFKVVSRMMQVRRRETVTEPYPPIVPFPRIILFAKEGLTLSSSDLFERVKKQPYAYSMSVRSAIRRENTEHFKELLKRVCHAWGLSLLLDDPKGGGKIKGDGNSPFKSLLSWMSFLDEDGGTESRSLLSHFSRVLHYKMEEKDVKASHTGLAKGEVTVCLTGYVSHTAYALFKKNIAIYANRGNDSAPSGATVYRIPDARAEDKSAIDRFVFDKTRFHDAYYSEANFVADYAPTKVAVFEMKPQMGGNCSLSSLKTASLFLLALDKIGEDSLEDGEEWKKVVGTIKPFYKGLTNDYRISAISFLLDEVELFLREAEKDKKEALFYSQLLYALLIRVRSTGKWDLEERRLHCVAIRNAFYRVVEAT